MTYWDNGHMNNGWGILMMLVMLSVWVLIALGIVWFVRSTQAPAVPPTASGGQSATRSAEQILAERLAHGDINPEEYRDRLRALNTP